MKSSTPLYYVRFKDTTCCLLRETDGTLAWVTANKRRDATGFESEAAARKAFIESKAGRMDYCEVLIR